MKRIQIKSKKQAILTVLTAALVIGVIGVSWQLLSKAATPTAAVEPENGTVTSPAQVATDSTASGGKAVKFTSAATSSTLRRMGIYYSGGNDLDVFNGFGFYPEISSTYYQPGDPNIDTTKEMKRIDHGTAPNITLTAHDTQRIAGIATGNAADLAWLDTYVASLKTISDYGATKGIPVYATLYHEWEVSVNRNSVTGASALPTNYGKALATFFKKCKANAPNVTYTYWVGGFDTAAIKDVMVQLVAEKNSGAPAPKVITMDPYVNGNANETLSQNFAGGASTFRGSGKLLNPYYVALGSPALAVTEHGIQTADGEKLTDHTDAEIAAYFVNMRQAMVDNNILFSIFFNSDNTNPHMITPGGKHPVAAAVTNLKASYAQK